MIIKLKNSLLLIRVNPSKDNAVCFFIFSASWLSFKYSKEVFDLNKVSLHLIKKTYEKLADDWNRKYRI